MINFILIYCC